MMDHDPTPFRLKRRREMVLASEVLEMMRSRQPADPADVERNNRAISAVEDAINEIVK